MRSFAAFLALLAVCHAATLEARQGRVYESIIKDAIGCINTNLNNGIPELGLPSLNPLVIPDRTLNLNKLNLPDVSGELTVTNFLLSNITNWNYDNMKGSVGIIPPGFTLNYELTNPKITIESDYDMNLVVKGQKVFGKGHVAFTINDEVNKGVVKVTIGDKGLTLKDFNLELSLASSELQLTGYMNDETLSSQISQEVSSKFAEFVNANKETISKAIHDFVMELANHKTKEIRDVDVVAIIKELGKRCIHL